MNHRYRMELEEFQDNFGKLDRKRIVLYGIGRYTATLLNGASGFHFVGLMDKDPANIGKELFGLPVISLQEAEEKADLIIINTAETYWRVIYRRISSSKIPVFYRNGKKAGKEENADLKNPFKDLSYENLCGLTETADIVSYDFFDTLFMRNICSSGDIFLFVEIEIGEKWNCSKTFSELRNEAKSKLRNDYSIDELYEQIERLSKMPHSLFDAVKHREIEIEKKLLIPRRRVLSSMKQAMDHGKEVYIISDMYLPEYFYREVLEQHGIRFPEGHILLSHVLDSSKTEGTLWKHYSEKIVKDRQALHIGDDRRADMEMPVRYGIKTYQVPGPWKLLEISSMREATSHICTIYGSAVMGCVLKGLFRDPYVLSDKNGMVRLKHGHEIGYCVFGPVILTFLLWLLERCQEDHVRKLIFMSRDGYFLKEDFEYLRDLTGTVQECCYLGISRQLAMAVSIESVEELKEYAYMPYTGTIGELFEDRFGIRVREREDIAKNDQEYADRERQDGTGEELIKGYIDQYLPEIESRIREMKKDYLRYIEGMGFDEDCATVDLGYYGNNQRYLNKLSRKKMTGYYFNANLSGQNQNAKDQKMTACFQKKDDSTGKYSNVLKRQIYLESFLTAPYGMVKAVDYEGNLICAEKRKNQEHFQDKREINEGVKKFIYDYVILFQEFKLRPDLGFIDWYYGYCFDGAMEFSEDIKKSFYNDNAMMNRIESMLFY